MGGGRAAAVCSLLGQPSHFWSDLGMSIPGKTASKLLIWLTACLMPFQAVWAVDCGCCSKKARVVTSAAESNSTTCCHKAVGSKPVCCKARVSQRTCCGRVAVVNRGIGCQCGPACTCVDHSPTPAEPPLPPPAEERGQSKVDLAVTSLPTNSSPASLARPRAHGLEAESAFSQPGARICVLLCRFTL